MIELQNDYYSNLQCSDFDIIPSPESVKLMKSRRMIFKIADNKLVVLLARGCSESFRPSY